MKPVVLIFTVTMLWMIPARAEEVLSLSQALELLDQKNPTLAEAKSRVEEAQAVVRQTTSFLLPSLSVTGGYTRNSDEAKLDLGALASALSPIGMNPTALPSGVTIQPLDAFTVAGAVRIPIFLPSAFAERRAAKHGMKVWELTAENVHQRLRGILRQTAWMAQVQEELVTVAEKAVANAKAHREYVARAVAVGTQPELTRLKAETELVKRQSDLVKAQSELARGRWALGALLGRQAPVHVVVDETIPREAPTVDSMVFEDALKLRPELRLEDTRKEVARAQGLAAKLRFVPQVSASAAWFASTEPYPTGLRSGWRLTLDAVWSIYDGGMRESRVAQSMATEAAATAAKTSRQIQVVQEITDAAREIVVSQERLRLAEEQVHFAKEAAASANRSFTAGLVGSLDVLDANDRLYQADVSLAEAKGRLGVAFTNYNLARGY